MKKILYATLFSTLFPLIGMAQVNQVPLTEITDINSLSAKLISIGNLVIYLLVAVAVVFIVWNVVMYMIKGDNAEEKVTASKNVLWGIVGLAIIVSIWGLVNILVNTFSTDKRVPTGRFPNANFISNTNSSLNVPAASPNSSN